MKKIISLALAFIMVVALIPSQLFSITASAAISTYYTYEVVGGEAIITDVKDSIGGNIVIPSTLYHYPVAGIDYKAFYNCNKLKSITIPRSVTSIGNYAFYGCSSLTSINIPDGVTNIGQYAFYGCSGLTRVALPDNITRINDCTFEGCSGLTYITIPHGVTSIDERAFYGCSGLTGITIPNSVTNIDKGAFYGCSGITSIAIPDSVTNIDNAAFSACSGLTHITIPDSVNAIRQSAFSSCSGLTSVTIGSSVTQIHQYAFAGCSGLESITIPDSVNYICEGAFKNCTKLKSITIPDSVTWIHMNAFWGCSELTSVTIGNGVTRIDDFAFRDCSKLTSITIPESVTKLGGYVFKNCSSLTSVTIPNSVNDMPSGTFSNCDNLTLYIDDENLYAIEYAQTNEINYTTCHVHTYAAKKIISHPTCTESGRSEATCTECGYRNVTEIEALGHRYKAIATAPTCTEKGYITHTCTRCSETITDEAKALGHYYNVVAKEPTCTEPGYNKYTCADCDNIETEELDALGHTFVKGETIAPTLTEQGYTLYLCENCNATEKRNYTSYVLPQKTQNVTVTPTDIGFNVSWDAVSYADGYYVRIREKDGTTNITNVNVKGTSYEFAIGKNGLSLDYDKEYTIQVIAQVGSSYQKWADADKVTSKMVISNRVVDVKATEYRNGAQVTFRPVEGATKYWVFVRNAADDSAVYTIKTTETTVNIVNNMVGGTEYYVQIVAYADSALDSRLNALKTKFTAPYVLPSTYEIAAKTPTSFSITWDAVAGADTYFVQVRTEDDTPVRTVTVSGKTIAAVAMYSDGSKLSANTTYKFRIAATINGVTTGYGEWMTYTTGDYEAVTVNAEKVDNKVKISWNDISDSHAVYLYKIDANGKKTYFKYLENGETSYTIKAPASGSYSYGVVTVQRNISGDAYNPIAISNTLTF